MRRIVALLALIVPAAAPAQDITSYRTNNPSTIKGDPDKVVCEREETIGTRLGAKKVCLTVSEWNERAKADRDQTERVQAGTRVCANPPCPSGG
jgi:hypothetical protein